MVPPSCFPPFFHPSSCCSVAVTFLSLLPPHQNIDLPIHRFSEFQTPLDSLTFAPTGPTEPPLHAKARAVTPWDESFLPTERLILSTAIWMQWLHGPLPEPLPIAACSALEAQGLAGHRPPSWVAAMSSQSTSPCPIVPCAWLQAALRCPRHEILLGLASLTANCSCGSEGPSRSDFEKGVWWALSQLSPIQVHGQNPLSGQQSQSGIFKTQLSLF